MITQLLDSDRPVNILATLHLRAQKNGLVSPDGVCPISTARLVTRLYHNRTSPMTKHLKIIKLFHITMVTKLAKTEHVGTQILLTFKEFDCP